jgi:hypothetical protein
MPIHIFEFLLQISFATKKDRVWVIERVKKSEMFFLGMFLPTITLLERWDFRPINQRVPLALTRELEQPLPPTQLA